MTEEVHQVADADAMHRLGAELAERFGPGDLILLSGPLGAGKTTLVQGLAEGMGVSGRVTSPTFVIARVHSSGGSGPDLVHVDAYRLTSFAEVEDLDLEVGLDESVTVVEWGEGKVESLSRERTVIRIERDVHPRTVTIRTELD